MAATMSDRNGYTPVPPEVGSPSRGPSHRRKFATITLVLGLVAAMMVIASRVSGRESTAKTQEVDHEVDDLWSVPALKIKVPALHSMTNGAAKACQGAAGFLHMNLCSTTTITTTVTTTTATTTSTTLTTTTTTNTDTSTTTTKTSTTTSTVTTTTRTTTTVTTTTHTTTSTTRTTSTSTVTSTTVTTTVWNERVKYTGCFTLEDDNDESALGEQNSLPAPLGFTSAACVTTCRNQGHILLRDGGRCSCISSSPKDMEGIKFFQLHDSQCGNVCETEESLLPKRFCGGKKAYAAYEVSSVANIQKALYGGHEDEVRLGASNGISLTRGGAWKKGQKPTKDILKGISYGPVPLKDIGHIADDDFMSVSTEALWSSSVKGRGDLRIMKSLGANTVRLYGDDPRLDHSKFLDEAMREGVQVIVGISDYPYTQAPDNCLATESNCYEQVKAQYRMVMRKGFLSTGNVYHPALRTVILMNEPDLKFPGGPASYVKAIVSALDAVLDVEAEFGVVGSAPSLTATFSFGVCGGGCPDMNEKPALGQMLYLRDAMRDPHSVGYEPRNDLWKAYQERFINSVNTANPATDIRWLFLDTYDEQFPETPVFIGEYHSPRTVDQQRDLKSVLDIARDNKTMLIGISFFEFQVRYDKGGDEECFGMFGLDKKSVADFNIEAEHYDAFCLKPVAMKDVAQDMWANKCGGVEFGVDFITDSTWSRNFDRIPTPEFCCDQCAKHAECKSWTWVEDAGLGGVGSPAQCWLKGGLPVGKAPKDGVISGVPGAPQNPQLTEQALWNQCGGKYWDGPTRCASRGRCVEKNEWYSQCLPATDDTKMLSLPGAPQEDTKLPNIYVHAALTEAYGGEGVAARDLCPTFSTTTTVTTTRKTAPTTAATTASTSAAPAEEAASEEGEKESSDEEASSSEKKEEGEEEDDDEADADKVGDESVSKETSSTDEGAVETIDDEASDAQEEEHGPSSDGEWYGCFMKIQNANVVYSNEQGGFDSATCVDGCRDFGFAFLHNEGHCSCGEKGPETSNFKKVDDWLCKPVCQTEEGQTPERYCGGFDTFAVYTTKNLIDATVRLSKK